MEGTKDSQQRVESLSSLEDEEEVTIEKLKEKKQVKVSTYDLRHRIMRGTFPFIEMLIGCSQSRSFGSGEFGEAHNRTRQREKRMKAR